MTTNFQIVFPTLNTTALYDPEVDEVAIPIPEPQYRITTPDGWLSPDGLFYPCKHWQHIQTAEALGFHKNEIEDMGWIKLSDGEFFIWNRSDTMSQHQLDIIYDYCTECKKPLPNWLKHYR